MPRFRVKSPDGTTYEVNAPEGATQQDAIAYVQANAASIPKAETSFLRDVGGAAIRGAGQIVSLPGQLAGLVTGDMDNISTRAGKAVEEFGEELQTPAFRELQRQQAARVEEAGKEGFLSGFGQQAKELLTDPLSLAAGIAQTAPAMIGTGGAGLAGRALAGRLIGQQAAKRGALAGAATGEAAIVGGDAAQATYDRVSQMPQEVVARSDAYQAAIAEGATPEEARNAAAISAARRAAAVAAPIAAATGPLGLEAALLTGGLRRGVIRGGAEGAIREGGTEIVQETGQGVAENVGAQAIDPNVALTEDLGGRAAAGLILGGTMGGGAGAISGLRGPEAEPAPEPGTEPPPPAAGPEVEPEPGVPATPFGAPPVSKPPPAGPAGETVTIEDDEVTIEYPDGRIETIPRADWDARQKAAAAPVETPTAEPVTEPAAEPVVEPVTEPVIEPTVAEPVVAEPIVAEPVVAPVTPTEPAAPAPPVEPVVPVEPAAPVEPPAPVEPAVPVETPSGPINVTPPKQPISATPIEDIEAITPEQFAAAETATAEIQKMIAGKTMPQVARELGQTAILDTTRSIMPRVANILDDFEKAGIQLRIGFTTAGKSGIPGINLQSTTRGKAAWSSLDSSMNVFVQGMDGLNPGTSERTLAHELIHAVTVLGIKYQDRLPPNSGVSNAVSELKSLSRVVAKRMREDEKAGTLGWTKKYRIYRQDPNEVLAWGLTDSNFQNYLKTIPTKTGNAFTDFVRYIGKLLGVAPKDQNALARLIEITERIIPEGQQDIADVTTSAARSLGATGIGGGVQPEVDAGDTETAAFKKWFGDSKVVDKNGKPMVVYHGTSNEFDSFDIESKPINRAGNVEGFYFTPLDYEAADYGPRIVSAYLSISRPYESGELEVTPELEAAYRSELEKNNRHLDPVKDANWFDRKVAELRRERRLSNNALNGNGRAIRTVLQAGGYDGARDGRHWVAFDPSQIKPVAKAKAAMGEPVTGSAEARASTAPPQRPPPPPPQQPPPQPAPSPPPPITPTKETRVEGWARKIVDRFERLRVVQNLGQLRAGIEGFYEAARKFDSRAGELMAKFNRDYFQPIEKIMKEAGLNLETVDAYLYARAAPDRNARLKAKAENEIRAKMEKKIRTEMEADGAAEADIQAAIADADADIQAAIRKAAADGKIPEAGSGMTTQEANDIMNGFRGQDYFPALERIGEIFNRANKERMQNNIQRGLVSREIGERLLREEPNYVPMKGSIVDENLTEPAEDFEDVMGYGGSGFGVSVREWYDTRGRTSLGFSPLSTFVSDVGTSIVRGERNRVGQKLMTFFIDNPSESWKVFSYRNPPRNRNGDIQRPSPFDPNFMVVKRGGDTFYLRIDDPLLAKAAKNLNPQQMNSLLQISSNLTRMLSRSFTTANPDFFVPNVFRDLQSAALNLGAEAPGLLKAFRDKIKDGKAFRSVAAFEYGREGGDPAMRELYEQFKLDGGSVSWVQRETPQEASARIQKDLKTVNDSLKDLKEFRSAKQAIDAVWNPTSKGFRAMVGALESTNATFENSVRFAAYRAALEIGMSREQAAMISREATVDFNRRGEAGALLNALYAFFNAGIQGSVRTARALSNNPFKTGKLSTTQAALLGMMTTAATLAAANAALSDEDDDGKLFWDKIPDYEKQRNLIIMNPLDGKTYTKIPMPYGFGFFPYLATRTMDAARRDDDLGAVGLDIVTAGLGNFSPVQFGAGNIPSSVARAVTPTMGKPFVELMLNENYMGKPIYNEPFDKGQSYASVARFNTWDGYKELSQFLNDISGGEGKLKGNLNAPAESFEYLTEFAFGGVTNLAKSLYRTGEEGDVVAAPVVRRLVGQPGKGRNVGEYYEREERARVVNQQMKDLTGLERRALIEKFPAETNPRVQSALTSARSAVRKLNEERKRIRNLDIDEGVKAERLEVLRERADGEFVRFNRVYNQVEQATS